MTTIHTFHCRYCGGTELHTLFGASHCRKLKGAAA